MSTYVMRYGSDSVQVELGAPEDDIRVDGESIGRQVADGDCDVDRCMQLAAVHCWGPLYATAEDAEEDGRSVGVDNIMVWEDVDYDVDTSDPEEGEELPGLVPEMDDGGNVVD